MLPLYTHGRNQEKEEKFYQSMLVKNFSEDFPLASVSLTEAYTNNWSTPVVSQQYTVQYTVNTHAAGNAFVDQCTPVRQISQLI